jgi:hypothetical protein
MTSADLLPAAVLKRKAVVYVRQSTQAQVQTNLESQRRQYELVDVARRRGFRDVEVIDDDLGRSASGMVARPGFERLVAWLCAGEVGAVLCFDASRLARNGRDWHHVLELCGLVEARVIDLDGVYDPTSRYPYPAEEFSARAGNGHRSGASALWADVRARLADKGTRPGQLRPGCLPRRHHAEDPDRGDEPAAGRTEHACEQAHAPRHPGAGTPRHPGRTA